MKTIIAIIIIAFIATPVFSESFYMCIKNGKKVISNVPCTSGREMITRDIGVVSTPESKEKPDTGSSTTINNGNEDRVEAARQRLNKLKEKIAKKKNSNSYEVKKRISEKNGLVEISGRIYGPQCKNLKVEAFAHSSNGGIVHCVDVTSLSGNSTLYSCKDDTHRRGESWFVSSFYVDCMD